MSYKYDIVLLLHWHTTSGFSFLIFYGLTWNISTSRKAQSPLVIPNSWAASINLLTSIPRTLSITTVKNCNFLKSLLRTLSKQRLWIAIFASVKMLDVSICFNDNQILTNGDLSIYDFNKYRINFLLVRNEIESSRTLCKDKSDHSLLAYILASRR